MPDTGKPACVNSPSGQGACTCGEHESLARHAEDLAFDAHGENILRQTVETAVMRALFPSALQRRAILRAIGASAALAAIGEFFPLATATEAFADTGPIEKRDIKIGFLPSTCATPIIMAAPMGMYAKHGLQVEVIKTPNWADSRDRTLNQEYDAAHLMSPMPLAIALGLGSPAARIAVPMIENVNGQSIVLATKHTERREPSLWKGFKVAIPFEYSMHNYLLRYYLAERGVDPDKDLTLVIMPPREMIASLAGGKIDAFFAQDNLAQRAVLEKAGFIHMLSKEIWNGHPCCAFAALPDLIAARPNTYRAMMRAIIEANVYARKPSNRRQVAEFISPANYLDQPVEVIEAVLTGNFDDGLGNSRSVPDRIKFDVFPWESFAVWIMTQMKRWGQIKGDVDYAAIARQVFLATGAMKLMADAGLQPPQTAHKTFEIMGRPFDAARPEEYLASLPMKRTG